MRPSPSTASRRSRPISSSEPPSPLWGGNEGGGQRVPLPATPHPNPSPQGGGPVHSCLVEARMVTIRPEIYFDTLPRERLLDKAFGKQQRRRKTSERLREGRMPSEGLAFTATDAK